MKFSTNALRGIFYCSTLSFIDSCTGSHYLGKAVAPANQEMRELVERKNLVSEKIIRCAPRERNGSISDKCFDLVLYHDRLEKDATKLENSSPYVLAQQQKGYANYLLLLTLVSMGVSMVASRKLAERFNDAEGDKP